MKSLGAVIGSSCSGGPNTSSSEDDLLFGTSSPRNYGSSFCGSGKSRPTMISAKYRLKEERRKVLKISVNKLKKIEDPESSLRRSVLINNTVKRLQKEAREEKSHKQQIHSYPARCYTPSTSVAFNVKDDSREDTTSVASVCSTTSLNEMSSVISPTIHDVTLPLTADANKENTSPFPSSSVSSSLCPVPSPSFENTSSKSSGECEDFVKVADVGHRLVASDCLCDSSMDDLVVDVSVSENDNPLALPVATGMEMNNPSAVIGNHNTSNNPCTTAITSRKRSFDEVEECDVHDVLSQFYMPPTPRMLTSIDDTDDEDEDVNVVDIDIVTPELELAESSALQRSNVDNVTSTNSTSTTSSVHLSSLSVSHVNQEEPMSSSYKRPRFSDGTDDLVLDVDAVKELELGKNVDQKTSSLVPSAISEIPVTPDRLTRATDICCTDLPGARDLDDREDIEVVLEDSEDVQRRMLLYSATASTTVTRTSSSSSACWALSNDSNVRTSGQTCDSPVVALQTEVDEETQHHHLRFSSNLSIDTKPGLPVGNANGTYCGIANDNNSTAMATNAGNNSSPMMLDTMEQHQYSCGHSSIFSELQSVVFHSLIPSLES